MTHRGKSQPHSFGYGRNLLIPFALITVAVPAQATCYRSPCNSEVHSVHSFGQVLTYSCSLFRDECTYSSSSLYLPDQF